MLSWMLASRSSTQTVSLWKHTALAGLLDDDSQVLQRLLALRILSSFVPRDTLDNADSKHLRADWASFFFHITSPRATQAWSFPGLSLSYE